MIVELLIMPYGPSLWCEWEAILAPRSTSSGEPIRICALRKFTDASSDTLPGNCSFSHGRPRGNECCFLTWVRQSTGGETVPESEV